MLWHISYVSRASEEFSVEALQALEEQASFVNQSRDITGLLVYDGSHFFQFLEGERDVVESIYSKICKDSRHISVTTLSEGPMQSRLFARWAMKSFLPSDFILEDRVHILDILSQKHEKESIPDILSGLTISKSFSHN